MPPRCWAANEPNGCRGVSALDFVSVMVLFWYTTLLEVPRYVIGAIAAPIAALSERPRQPPDTNLTVSVILAGYDEAQSLRACIAVWPSRPSPTAAVCKSSSSMMALLTEWRMRTLTCGARDWSTR